MDPLEGLCLSIFFYRRLDSTSPTSEEKSRSVWDIRRGLRRPSEGPSLAMLLGGYEPPATTKRRSSTPPVRVYRCLGSPNRGRPLLKIVWVPPHKAPLLRRYALGPNRFSYARPSLYNICKFKTFINYSSPSSSLSSESSSSVIDCVQSPSEVCEESSSSSSL